MSRKESAIKLNPKKMPQHIAIILDGNGRWAKKRGLSRSEGHRAGGENLDRLLETFVKLKVPYVSLYAFSTENWNRPPLEIKGIWSLLNEFFENRLHRCQEFGIKIKASGNLKKLPAGSRKTIEDIVKQTSRLKNLTANFCINYGSHEEIINAANELVQDRLAKMEAGEVRKANSPIKKKEFERHLYTSPLPPVDLLVRPGGESRISNFLLWQCSYAEIFLTDTLWPDFTEDELIKAIAWFQERHRRFGGL